MALFTDGPGCTIESLADEDSGLLDIAQTNSINVTTKLRLAHKEIETELHLRLVKTNPAVEMIWQPGLRVGQIVMTTALERWERMHSLALVYRDAYFSQLVDRYQAKWQEFMKLAEDAREDFVASGLGIVLDPVRKAEPPALGSSPAPQPGGTFYASVSWINSTNQEGAPSAPSSITIIDGNLMTVTAPDPPKNATGFNVYAGTSPLGMFLQNQVLLPIGNTYQYLAGEVTQGRRPGSGQEPDYMRPLPRVWMRG